MPPVSRVSLAPNAVVQVHHKCLGGLMVGEGPQNAGGNSTGAAPAPSAPPNLAVEPTPYNLRCAAASGRDSPPASRRTTLSKVLIHTFTPGVAPPAGEAYGQFSLLV